MKQFVLAISTGWNLVRWLRLSLGAMVIFQAVKSGDSFLTILGAAFTMQSVFNVGCCGTSSCAPSPFTKSKKIETNDEVTYTEVK
jgi:hypothetical protein